MIVLCMGSILAGWFCHASEKNQAYPGARVLVWGWRSMLKHPILKKRTVGNKGVASAPFDVALRHAWPFDAYIVQYAGTTRLNKSDIATTPMIQLVELYDFDTPGHEAVEKHANWAVSALERLPEGFQACLTAGGFRVWTKRAAPFVIDSPELWEEWRAYHAGRAEALGRAIGAEPDHATDDPGRLFRLPNVQREDGKPCYPELIGELGIATLAPLPWEVKPATSVSAGPAGASMLGEVFAALGWVRQDGGEKLTVRCPWAHEHSSDDLAVVYATEDGVGKFHCGHTHCAGRHTPEALEAMQDTPAAAEVLARWLYKPESDSTGDLNSLVRPVAGGEETSQKTEVTQKVKQTGNFPLMTAEDMDIDEPIPWIVEGLVSVGEPTMIVGGAGSGKTSAMVSLAIAVACGLPVWGHFKVARSGPVVHVDYEQGKTLRRTYRAFAAGLGQNAAQLVRDGKLRIAPLPAEQLLDANVTDKHLSAVGSELVKLCRGATLCVINSLTASTNKVNENDAKIAAVFNLLARISEITGCAFVVLHHSGKGAGGSRGSSAIDGAVQTVFQISHKKGDAHTVWTHTKDRPAGGLLEPFRLLWTAEPDRQTLLVEEVKDEAPEPGAERPEDRIARAILFVMSNKGLSGKDRILECVRGKKTAKRLVWDDLLIKGMIEHVGSRYLVAAGVPVPKTQPDGIRDEDE